MSNIEFYLKLVWFVMVLTLLYFQQKKYSQLGDIDSSCNIWLHLYLSKVTEIKSKYVLWRVIYRDDVLLAFKGRKYILDIQICRETF